MKIHVERSQEAVILRVSGDLRLWGKQGEETRLLAVLRGEPLLPSHVVLNLSGVTHIDSMGIGSLTRILIECAKRNSELRVVPPGGFPGQVLEHVRVFATWPQFQDEASAL